MFSGIKVIELAGVLAGPSVGMFLSELGADVIKIENPKTGGDMTRQWKLPSEDQSNKKSAYYYSVNWGKEELFMDLTADDDLKELHKLLTDADIVITNFKKKSAQKMGLDPDTLRKLYPRLIISEITGFPDDEDRVAFDVVLQAEAGFMYMNGTQDSGPVKLPVAMIDILAAHQLKEGILYALWQRERTDDGCIVSVSLLEAALASLANQATNWLDAGHIPQRLGTLHPNIAPYGEIFTTKDNAQLVLAVGTDKQFFNLCKILGEENLAKKSEFISNNERVKHRIELAKHLQEQISLHDCDELIKKMIENEIPAGRVRNMKEVFELPAAQKMLLVQGEKNNTISMSVQSAVFRIR